MHLLQATPGSVLDDKEPVDLGQTPADILVISAADTELASLSEAFGAMVDPGFSLRLANLSHLAHPMSVDLYLDQTALKSKLVIIRLLGGSGYWSYGLEQFSARLKQAGIPVVFLPGDDKPDEELLRSSSLDSGAWHQLWQYLVEGGAQNAADFLRFAYAILSGSEPPPKASPLLRAGIYWPGEGIVDSSQVLDLWQDQRPVAAIVFYRALIQGAGLHPVNRLVAQLSRLELNPLPVFVASLKDPVSAATLAELFDQHTPKIVLNLTSFAVSSPGSEHKTTPLDRIDAPVLQLILAGSSEQAWEEGLRGLSARDIAMNVALPEVDGRIITRAVSFKAEAYYDAETECRIASYRARGDRIAFTAQLAKNYVTMAQKPRSQRKVAILLANYPNRDGRLANGVGLDTPASALTVLKAMASAGYQLHSLPEDAKTLMDIVLAGPTNWMTDRFERSGGAILALEDYLHFFENWPFELRQTIQDRWGLPQDDPFFKDGGFRLSVHDFGNVVIGVQPARGFNIDPAESYHSPDLVPPHNYIAFYAYLSQSFEADAIVHLGKHGNLEWLPGKALALSEACLPEAVLGPIPHFYPFIVNDPGEGSQAKRRTQAVIIDHLTPPLTRAESYGPLRDLEALVDEYYEAAGVDPRRLAYLRDEILSLTRSERLDLDAGIEEGEEADEALAKLDNYLCELKESQIRDGLHVFGQSPTKRLRRDLALALVRLPRGEGKGGNQSLIRAIAADLGFEGFDPLDCVLGAPWEGAKPSVLELGEGAWRTFGDTVERLELMAAQLLDGVPCPENWKETNAVLKTTAENLLPSLDCCGPAELAGLLKGLDGQFVEPGSSGAPTRGRLDVLPTGRNFYSVDSRAVPTPAAWHLGWKSASLMIERYLQDHGDWPRSMALSAWGTANMRTGGDDIAQALALIGARPTWDQASRRVTGFEVLPASVLDRPRVDVTLRISGFFRDAFPNLIELFASAAGAIMKLSEPIEINPLAAQFRTALDNGMDEERAALRVFGSKPGAYGAGLQAMIDERLWEDRADLADAYLAWGSYGYGTRGDAGQERAILQERLSTIEAVVQNQDNREHDLLDSDDYYQFEGGLAASIATLRGREPEVYHNDHSRPERPVIRTLEEEIGRVVRSRVVNPKWLDGVKRHGYKGAFEIAATIDYLFAFAATTRAVKQHHFDLVFEAVLGDERTRHFLSENNAPALTEIAQRFDEAIERGLWQPTSNKAPFLLNELRAIS